MLLTSMHRDFVTTLYISNISHNVVGILLTRGLFSQTLILQSQSKVHDVFAVLDVMQRSYLLTLRNIPRVEASFTLLQQPVIIQSLIYLNACTTWQESAFCHLVLEASHHLGFSYCRRKTSVLSIDSKWSWQCYCPNGSNDYYSSARSLLVSSTNLSQFCS